MVLTINQSSFCVDSAATSALRPPDIPTKASENHTHALVGTHEFYIYGCLLKFHRMRGILVGSKYKPVYSQNKKRWVSDLHTVNVNNKF